MSKEERNEALVEMVRNGATYPDVAERFGLRLATVKKIVRMEDFDLFLQRRSPQGRPSVPSAESDRMKQVRAAQKERRAEIAEFLFAHPEMTLDEVGQHFDVTREWVRQCANSVNPERYEQRKKVRHEQVLDRHAEARQMFLEARADRRCKLCGVNLPISHRSFCSDDHRDKYNSSLRYHVDNDYRQRHRRTVARWMIAHPDELEDRDRQLRYAERVLAGEDLEPRGRWLTAGSKAMDIALECYRNGWPAFDRLPADVQRQVIDVHRSWEG